MNKVDLHVEFVNCLHHSIPKQAQLIEYVADILDIEKDSVYRRITGRVLFTVREIGLLCKKMNISLDQLIFTDEIQQWMPFTLQKPIGNATITQLEDKLISNIELIKKIAVGPTAEYACAGNRIAFDLFFYSPLMWKYTFFQLGRLFVRSDEFDNFSDWKMSERMAEIPKLYPDIFKFGKVTYIWDHTLIPLLCGDIYNLFKLNVITTREKMELKQELKRIIYNIQLTLTGMQKPSLPLPEDFQFYISSSNLGIYCCYIESPGYSLSYIESKYVFSTVFNQPRIYSEIKEWVNSFKSISTMLTGCGYEERRLFFRQQTDLVDRLLS